MTAVEWIQNEYNNNVCTLEQLEQAFEKAKEIEQRQIESAWTDGNYKYSGFGDSETYYNETYEQ